MASIFAEEEVPRRDFIIAWILYSAETILNLRAIQFHRLRNQIDPALQGNALLPSDFTEHIYHAGSSHDMHSIIQSGQFPGGKDVKKGRHAVFCTAVNPMYIDHDRERDYDVTKPRIAVYKHIWKIHILGRNKTRLELWEEHIKDPIAALDNALKCVKSQ